MKKIFLPALLSGVLLFILSYLILLVSIQFIPSLLEEYYNPIFWPGSDRAILFYIHPLILSLALAWLWDRIKSIFKGNAFFRGVEFGLLYGLVATLPSMWITFSALDVTIMMVLSWLAYGVIQATVAGLIFARLNP